MKKVCFLLSDITDQDPGELTPVRILTLSQLLLVFSGSYLQVSSEIETEYRSSIYQELQGFSLVSTLFLLNIPPSLIYWEGSIWGPYFKIRPGPFELMFKTLHRDLEDNLFCNAHINYNWDIWFLGQYYNDEPHGYHEEGLCVVLDTFGVFNFLLAFCSQPLIKLFWILKNFGSSHTNQHKYPHCLVQKSLQVHFWIKYLVLSGIFPVMATAIQGCL